MSEFRLVCPACNGPLVIRCSKGETPCFRSLWYQCKNLACGATFGGTQTIDYQLSPSGLQAPRLVLPLAPSKIKRAATQASRMTSNQKDLLDPLEESTP
ncbi:transcriptional regulator [Pseudomonas oryzihabitans]|nr:transcriptional regulator [Pseudomonas psychrotolerans]KTT38592.1 transcriptional regulator [Pseudomonas psychrotolerans]